MSHWGWKPDRSGGIWHVGSPCLRPLVAAAPWITLLVLLAQFWVIGNTMTAAEGVLFDLPETELREGDVTGPVVLILPTSHNTLVYFDETRYLLDDAESAKSLGEHLADAVSQMENKTLLALADRRIACGELMKFAALARSKGVGKVLFAKKREDVEE